MNPRTVATKIIVELLNKNSLSKILKTKLTAENKSQNAFIQELCYGVTRWYFRLDFLAKQLIKKQKDPDIYTLILIGIYQLLYTKVAQHAAVSETVNTSYEFKKPYAPKFVNAILRNFLRKKDELLKLADQNSVAKYSHPIWLIERIKKIYPTDWENILNANNEHPPLSLRVNQKLITRDEYLNKYKIAAKINAHCKSCITLENACHVSKIPGFDAGEVSVQDCGAQLAAELLDLQPNQLVLDACAAPGSKATHILEMQPKIKELVCIDCEKDRLTMVEENLKRLNLHAKLICADVSQKNSWWDKKLFDRILLDAPCSATGVIRRHPDIKLLRKEADIKELAKFQLKLLNELWQTLKEKGKLLYVTCSILPDENQDVIEKFISENPNAKEIKIKSLWGIEVKHGKQILPDQENSDGFYYALLKKEHQSLL